MFLNVSKILSLNGKGCKQRRCSPSTGSNVVHTLNLYLIGSLRSQASDSVRTGNVVDINPLRLSLTAGIGDCDVVNCKAELVSYIVVLNNNVSCALISA